MTEIEKIDCSIEYIKFLNKLCSEVVFEDIKFEQGPYAITFRPSTLNKNKLFYIMNADKFPVKPTNVNINWFRERYIFR